MVPTEAETLELYRNSLVNAESQPVISSILSEFGYGPETIAQGKAVLAETQQAYDTNQMENDEYFSAYNAFTTKREELFDTYALDRKKAKVIFRNDPVVAERLGIRGSVPRTYMNWLETARILHYKHSGSRNSDTAGQIKNHPGAFNPGQYINIGP